MLSRIRHWALEDRYTSGLGGPPNTHRMQSMFRHREARYRGSFNNDAFEVWIWREYDDERGRWALFLPAPVFRKIALWYLWRWVWGEWFGLRRWLFYRDLKWRTRNYLRPFRSTKE